MKKIEVGQTIYVNIKKPFDNNESNLSDYIVTKVDPISFFAHEKNSDFERMFDIKKMQHRELFELYTAYLTDKEYWNLVNNNRMK